MPNPHRNHTTTYSRRNTMSTPLVTSYSAYKDNWSLKQRSSSSREQNNSAANKTRVKEKVA